MSKLIKLITFASNGFESSAAVLRDTAIAHGFDAAKIYGPRDVQIEEPHAPGHGWWAWKPRIIKRELDAMRDGDVLVYCDAAMAFESSPNPYVDAIPEDGILLFDVGGSGNTIGAWTRPEALVALDGESVKNEKMVNAAVQMYRACREARAFVDEWAARCTLDVLRDNGAKKHRHDQSILSIVARQRQIRTAADPTQWGLRDMFHPWRVTPGQELLQHHRRCLHNVAKVAVITATIGGPHLRECIESVQRQTLPNVEHWIVIDGPEHHADVTKVVAEYADKRPIVVAQLPRNVGSGGWVCHRVYGSFPFLVDADYVAYLDDDNAYEPDHLAGLLRAALDAKVEWAHSLRKIIDGESNDVCPDNCESLGGIFHTILGRDDYLIDTNCYLLKRDLAIACGPLWNVRARDPTGRLEADRALAKTLLTREPHAVVRRHTVRYRVSSRPDSVSAEFFVQGNSMRGYDFANKPDVYVFHFSGGATENIWSNKSPLDEWQPAQFETLKKHYNLLNGFDVAPNVPHGATVLVTMCHPQTLPLDMLASRTDLKRIVYTVESPNIRHAEQWDAAFLAKHFDVALTYWEPLLENPPQGLRAVFAPHNCHFLGFPDDDGVLRTNAGKGRSVAMVLEYRPMMSGSYRVNGVDLTCLDPLRGQLVENLRECTVVGRGWDAYDKSIDKNPFLKIVPGGKGVDTRHAVDWYAEHTFALIIENTDAVGYVSEKLYDALIAGAIPLYWGSPSRALMNHVPELDHLVIDIRGMSSTDIQELIDGMSDEQIASVRERIVSLRAKALARVGHEDFAMRVRAVI